MVTHYSDGPDLGPGYYYTDCDHWICESCDGSDNVVNCSQCNLCIECRNKSKIKCNECNKEYCNSRCLTNPYLCIECSIDCNTCRFNSTGARCEECLNKGKESEQQFIQFQNTIFNNLSQRCVLYNYAFLIDLPKDVFFLVADYVHSYK